MSESAASSSDGSISYLEDVDCEIGEFYTDPESATGPQPYMHEPVAVSVRVEVEHTPSDGDNAEAVPRVSQW